ncbi:MAG: KH domain-containing protein [Selenomonadaceae bacterium]|nr:KH domain-containing protein [Selenomonadaceae bacterium]
MKEIVENIAKALVENPDAVVVEEKRDEREQLVLELHVAPDDMGRVIGKQGRIANAIRTIVKAAATRVNERVSVDIV